MQPGVPGGVAGRNRAVRQRSDARLDARPGAARPHPRPAELPRGSDPSLLPATTSRSRHGCGPRSPRGKREALARPSPATGASRRRSGATTRITTTSSSPICSPRSYLEELVESAQLEPRGEGARALRGAAMDRRDVPGELRRHQPARRWRQALATRGESLTRGLANLLGDVQKKPHQPDRRGALRGRPQPRGHARATWCYENELIQLIQYRPTTPQVAARPLVMIPPCINKYYILDLQPENSLVGARGGRGQHGVHGVLAQRRARSRAISPGTTTSRWAFSPRFASAKEIARSDQVNALGFCVGGTLLGAALAVLTQKNHRSGRERDASSPPCSISPTPVRSACSSTRPSVAAREATIGARRHPARARAGVRVLQPAGERPGLAVRGEQLPAGGEPRRRSTCSTGTPTAPTCPGRCTATTCGTPTSRTSCASPGALTNCGVPVDLGKVKLPVVRAGDARGSHRAVALGVPHARPAWRHGQDLRPRRERPHCRRGQSGGARTGAATGPSSRIRADAEDWLSNQRRRPGSWWPVWSEWLARHKRRQRAAPATPAMSNIRRSNPRPDATSSSDSTRRQHGRDRTSSAQRAPPSASSAAASPRPRPPTSARWSSARCSSAPASRPDQVSEVIMGQVLTAGVGQNPARPGGDQGRACPT